VFFSGQEDVLYYSGYSRFLGHDKSTGFGLRDWSVLLDAHKAMGKPEYVNKMLRLIARDTDALARVRRTMQTLSEGIMYNHPATVRSGFRQKNMLTLFADVLMDNTTTSCDGEFTLAAGTGGAAAPQPECQPIPEGKKLAVAGVWVDLKSTSTADVAEDDATATVCELVLSLYNARKTLTSQSLCFNETQVELVVYTDASTLPSNTRAAYEASGIAVKDASLSEAMQQYASDMGGGDDGKLWTIHMYKLTPLWDTEYAAVVVSDSDVLMGAPSTCDPLEIQGLHDSCEEPFDIFNMLLDSAGPNLMYQHSSYSPANAGFFAGRPSDSFYELFASGINGGYDPVRGWGGQYNASHLDTFADVSQAFRTDFPSLWLNYNGHDANGAVTWCEDGTSWCFIGADQDQGMLAHMIASPGVRSVDFANYVPDFRFVHYTGRWFKAKPWSAYSVATQSDGGVVSVDLHEGLTRFWGEYNAAYSKIWESTPAFAAANCPAVYSCAFDDISTYSDKNQSLLLYQQTTSTTTTTCAAHKDAPQALPSPVLYNYTESSCPHLSKGELVANKLATVELRWRADGTFDGAYSQFAFEDAQCVAIARATVAAKAIGDLPARDAPYTSRFYPFDTVNELYGCKDSMTGSQCKEEAVLPEACPDGMHDPLLAFSAFKAQTWSSVSCVQLMPNLDQLDGTAQEAVLHSFASTRNLTWEDRSNQVLYLGGNDRTQGRYLRSMLWQKNMIEGSRNVSWLTISDHMERADAARFKFILDIATPSRGSWTSLAWKMASGALVFRVKNRARVNDLWSELIVPKTHLVEIEPDFSDLHDKMLWARKNPAQAEEIALQGQKLALSTQTQNLALSAFWETLNSTYSAWRTPTYEPPDLWQAAPLEGVLAPNASCSAWDEIGAQLREVNASSSTCDALDTLSDESEESAQKVTTKLLVLVSDHGSGSTNFIETMGEHTCSFSLGEPLGGPVGSFADVLKAQANDKMEKHINNSIERGKWPVQLPIPPSALECLSMEGLGTYLMRVARHVCSSMPDELVSTCGGVCMATAKVFPAYIGGVTDPVNSERIYDASDNLAQGIFNAASLQLWEDEMTRISQMPDTKVAMLVRDEAERSLSNWRRFSYESQWFNCDVERTGKETVYQASARRITGAPVIDIEDCTGGEDAARQCISQALGLFDLTADNVTMKMMTRPNSQQSQAGLNATCTQGGWLKNGDGETAVAVPARELASALANSQRSFAARADSGNYFNEKCGVGMTRPTMALPQYMDYDLYQQAQDEAHDRAEEAANEKEKADAAARLVPLESPPTATPTQTNATTVAPMPTNMTTSPPATAAAPTAPNTTSSNTTASNTTHPHHWWCLWMCD